MTVIDEIAADLRDTLRAENSRSASP